MNKIARTITVGRQQIRLFRNLKEPNPFLTLFLRKDILQNLNRDLKAIKELGEPKVWLGWLGINQLVITWSRTINNSQTWNYLHIADPNDTCNCGRLYYQHEHRKVGELYPRRICGVAKGVYVG